MIFLLYKFALIYTFKTVVIFATVFFIISRQKVNILYIIERFGEYNQSKC